jgi:hypothetical protein
MVCGW